VQPRYDNGRTVRFAQASSPEEIAAVAAKPPWNRTRVLFLQHASDPVVWWSPDLLLRKPDWLDEPPGFDRSPAMRWYPIITFWQVSADMAGNVTNSTGTPEGHGHNYGTGEMGEWHAGIQDLFEHYGAQVERARTSREGAKHRADVVCPDGRIVEAQTSYLAKHHVRSREDTYGDMCWLYGDMAQIDTLRLASDSDPTRFRWPGAHHRLLEHRRPVFLDRGIHGIWQLVWLDRRTTSDGRASWTCRLVKVADRQREFVQAIMSGRPFGDPPKMLDNKHDQRMARMQHRGQRQTVAEFMAAYHHERTYQPFEPRVRPSAPVAEAVVVKAMADRMRAAGWPGPMRSDGTYPERVA
jgi:hypothetical protein